MLRWKKLGHVFVANKNSDDVFSHGKCRAFWDDGHVIRAYPICYSRPDESGNVRSGTYSLELDRDDPRTIRKGISEGVLHFGARGEFDEHGVMGECVVSDGDRLLMYYDGWSRRQSVPYDWAIGVAESRDGGTTFRRLGRGPVIGPSVVDPFLLASPCIVRGPTGEWHAWYLAGDAWREDGVGPPYAIYTLKHARSADGLQWRPNGSSILRAVSPDECQAGATVIELEGVYHMIFSFRPGRRDELGIAPYQLGYAVSRDLETWSRKDEDLGLKLGPEHWDAEMMCYPQFLQVARRIFLFYSGNGYGRTGFGVAELARIS